MTQLEETLVQAEGEILSLRRKNEVLQAKVDTMDLFALVFTSQPNFPRQGMSEDIAWKIRQQINALVKKRNQDDEIPF